MEAIDKKIKDLKDFIKEKTDQGTANYLAKEIREICGMVESEQLLIQRVSNQRELLEAYDKFAEMEHSWFLGTEEETKEKFLIVSNSC